MGLAFIPLYIQIIGVESYAILGVFTSLTSMLVIFDLGLSQAMNREMARLNSEKQSLGLICDTARTLEVIYWAIALIVGLLVMILAGPLANNWLNPDQLSRADLQQALWIMGLVIALRWPVSLYMGGLNGLQKQVQLNVVLSIFATLQGVGALAVLWFVAPTIQAFFMWQVFVALAQAIVLRVVLMANLPRGYSGQFNRNVLRQIWQFAAGMTGISMLTIILTQLDKLILSKLLTLSDFGYYTFASTVAAVLFKIIGPVFTAYYPRLTELVTKKDHLQLVNVYHQGNQLMAVAILPIGMILVFFSKEILQIWTHNSELVLQVSLLVSLLSIGNILNGLMHMPYALQLAHGWTKFSLIQNVIAVVLLSPAIYFSTIKWGAVGAATVWILLNSAYILIGIHFMHRRLLSAEKWRWYLDDLIKPIAATVMLSFSVKLVLTGNIKEWAWVLVLIITFFLAVMAAIASSSNLCGRLGICKLWTRNN